MSLPVFAAWMAGILAAGYLILFAAWLTRPRRRHGRRLERWERDEWRAIVRHNRDLDRSQL